MNPTVVIAKLWTRTDLKDGLCRDTPTLETLYTAIVHATSKDDADDGTRLVVEDGSTARARGGHGSTRGDRMCGEQEMGQWVIRSRLAMMQETRRDIRLV